MNREHHDHRPLDRDGHGRHRRGERRHKLHAKRSLLLTEEGFPAATPDAPRPSPVVFVSDQSRERYPWLPGRVIAGSVWRGPDLVRVRVDENGTATPWRCVPGALVG